MQGGGYQSDDDDAQPIEEQEEEQEKDSAGLEQQEAGGGEEELPLPTPAPPETWTPGPRAATGGSAVDLLDAQASRNGTTALLAEKGYVWAQTKDDVTVSQQEAYFISLFFFLFLSFGRSISLLPCACRLKKQWHFVTQY